MWCLPTIPIYKISAKHHNYKILRLGFTLFGN